MFAISSSLPKKEKKRIPRNTEKHRVDFTFLNGSKGRNPQGTTMQGGEGETDSGREGIQNIRGHPFHG